MSIDKILKEFDKIMLEWIKEQWKLEEAHQAGEPYTRIKFEVSAYKVEQKLKDLLIREISQAEARGRESERERILEAIQPAVDVFMAGANILVEHKMVNSAREIRENIQYIVSTIRQEKRDLDLLTKLKEDI